MSEKTKKPLPLVKLKTAISLHNTGKGKGQINDSWRPKTEKGPALFSISDIQTAIESELTVRLRPPFPITFSNSLLYGIKCIAGAAIGNKEEDLNDEQVVALAGWLPDVIPLTIKTCSLICGICYPKDARGRYGVGQTEFENVFHETRYSVMLAVLARLKAAAPVSAEDDSDPEDYDDNDEEEDE